MAGRPTKLTEDIVKEAREYLDETAKFGGMMLPTIEGLALRLKTHRETITNWESKGALDEAEDIEQEFFDIVKELRTSQAEKLVQYGLTNKYNAMIAKLILSKHGYVEEKKVEQTINEDLELTRKKVESILDDLGNGEDAEEDLDSDS